MKRCINCNCDISDRGNRSVKCKECQRTTRHGNWDKKIGSIRCNKKIYRWAKQIKELPQTDLDDLISCYRNRLIGATGREKLDIKTRIKILCTIYQPNELKETIKEVDHENAILPHSERINWDKAKTGWTNYYDDGLVTLSPEVFFGKWKVDE